jgi:hypothetical protein
MARLAAATTMPKTIMIDATCLNAHRMGSSLRTKVRWIASASLGQRQLVINFHRHGHPGALHAKSAGRRRLSPGSASPHSGQCGRATLGGLCPHAKSLSWASVEKSHARSELQ